jgi:hypothetical protein
MYLHELGKVARDKITGFQGVITSRCEFLTGCNRYCVQPQNLHEGKPLDSIYFDEAQIEIVEDAKGVEAESVQGEKKGACSPDPS